MQKELLVVTGCNGRIGEMLCDRAAGEFRVIGMARKPEEAPSSVDAAIALDVGEPNSIDTALAEVRERFGTRIASVAHLAGFYDFSGEERPEYEAVNVRGSERLIRSLQAFEVEQFLFSSTMLVHPPVEVGKRVTEDSPIEPRWAYPQSKADTEARLRETHGAIPLVLARISCVYDEWCRHPMLSRQIQRVYEEQLTGRLFPGDPDHGTTYIHMEDLVEALLQTIRRRPELPPVTALLLGEDNYVSYADVQTRVGELLHGEGEEPFRVPEAVAKAGAWVQDKLGVGDDFIKPWMIPLADEHYALDSTQARKLLNWSPRRALRETLPAITENLRRDPERWYAENDLERPGAG